MAKNPIVVEPWTPHAGYRTPEEEDSGIGGTAPPGTETIGPTPPPDYVPPVGPVAPTPPPVFPTTPLPLNLPPITSTPLPTIPITKTPISTTPLPSISTPITPTTTQLPYDYELDIAQSGIGYTQPTQKKIIAFEVAKQSGDSQQIHDASINLASSFQTKGSYNLEQLAKSQLPYSEEAIKTLWPKLTDKDMFKLESRAKAGAKAAEGGELKGYGTFLEFVSALCGG